MKTKKNLFLVIFTMSLFLAVGCKKSKSEKELDDTWTVTNWSEDGADGTEAASLGIKLIFADVESGEGIMTIYSEAIEDENFNYTGSFTISDDDHINATINETTNNSEINQMIFSVGADIGSSELKLNGNLIKKSPFWPDNSVTISMIATK